MHEIKFRAWDKEEKRMINFNEPIWKDDWEGNTYLKLSMDGLLCTAYWDKRKYDYYKERFELMQYTGLKDKNGKEIYEGDIVHVQDNSHDPIWGTDEKHPIVFDGGAFRMDTLNIYELLGWGGYPRALTLEIIGNIYENNDLLK
jgi:uncharacterized phage protein (TIGR01671 family)